MTCSDLARYDPFSIRLRVAAAKGAAVRINIADSCERRTSETKTERASDRTKRYDDRAVLRRDGEKKTRHFGNGYQVVWWWFWLVQ